MNTSHEYCFSPQNETQKLHLRLLDEYDQVFAEGPAGTGKTYVSVGYGIDLLEADSVDRLLIVRPMVGVDEDIGILPGDVNDKVVPWSLPIVDAIKDQIGQKEYNKLVSARKIEFAPIGIMRGRSLNNAFILLDEAQNTTVRQMKMFLTRIGFHSKQAICGDLTQSDIKEQSGFEYAMNLARKDNLRVGYIEYEGNHVIRSAACRQWVSAFEREDKGQRNS